MGLESVENEKKKPNLRIFKGTVYIIKDRCKGCGWCIEYCPKKILKKSEDFNIKGYHYPIVIEQDACVNCKVCEDICPEFSIFSITKEEDSDTKGDTH
jgi:2-oxoglutarate ferredoxin oxidoreductase subunit delta